MKRYEIRVVGQHIAARDNWDGVDHHTIEDGVLYLWGPSEFGESRQMIAYVLVNVISWEVRQR